jgi:TonB family protein
MLKLISILAFILSQTTWAQVSVQPYGRVTVFTKPKGALLAMDGILIGKTPCTIDSVKPGKHALQFEKNGYAKNVLNLMLKPEDHFAASVFLEKNYEKDHTVSSDTAETPTSEASRDMSDAMALEPPEVVKHAEPNYPIECKKNGIEGKTFMCLLVDTSGYIIRMEVGKSSGNILLDNVSIEASKDVVFKPAKYNGKPIRTWVMYPFTFSLKVR